jgi:hypothetical protein
VQFFQARRVEVLEDFEGGDGFLMVLVLLPLDDQFAQSEELNAEETCVDLAILFDDVGLDLKLILPLWFLVVGGVQLGGASACDVLIQFDCQCAGVARLDALEYVEYPEMLDYFRV